jgi:hypothetical protein
VSARQTAQKGIAPQPATKVKEVGERVATEASGTSGTQQRWPSNTGEGNGRWLRSLRDTWPQVACTLFDQGEVAVVRVLVAEVRGSAPREPGTSMLVTSDGIHGTIGGGNLEWEAMRAAKALLTAGPTTRSVQVRRLV